MLRGPQTSRGSLWVRSGKPRSEHNESGFPLIADMERTFRHVADGNSGNGGALLNELTGDREQGSRHSEPKRPGSLEIDDELVFGRRLHRQIGGLLAAEDAIDVTGCTAILVDRIGAIRHQTTGSDVVAKGVNCRQAVLCG